MIDRSVLVHYRTEGAKAYRREHGDRGVQIPRQTASSQSVAVEQHHQHSNKRQPPMRNIQIAAFRGRDPDNPSDRKHPSCGRFRQRMEINAQGTTNTLTSVGKDNMVYIEYL